MRYFPILLAFACVTALPLQAKDKEPKDAATSEVSDEEGGEKLDPKEAKDARKAATDWLTAEVKDKTKALSLLKKVKDTKSADRSGQALTSLYGEKGRSTAMGTVGAPTRPTGPIMEECEKKFKAKLDKLNREIVAQMNRIEESQFNTKPLAAGMDALRAYYGMDSAESGK